MMNNRAVIVIMTTYTFGIRFRFDSAEYYQTYFDLALSDER